jgi:xanthine dehydrogenase YagR molybdenum-binding subunit
MAERYDVSQAVVNLPPIGDPLPRFEARAKVTGEARYAADEALSGALYAALVTTPITKGRITTIDTKAAEALPGVRLVLTHKNTDRHGDVKPYSKGGMAQADFQPLAGPDINYAGQIVAVIIAETLETAQQAANLVAVDAEPTGQPVASIHVKEAPVAKPVPEKLYPPIQVGDLEAALNDAEGTVDVTYTTPVQHHNPIELYFTSAEWRNGQLTTYVPSQWVTGTRAALATAFKLPVEKVRVISSVVGGAFGCKATVMAHTFLIAEAARRVNGPVKLYVSRDQMFTVGSFRPATIHRIRLGAKDGRLSAIHHEQDGQTSAMDLVFLPGTEQTSRLYEWQAIRTAERTIRTDTNTPGFMRAPAEVPALFALESAIDELAYEIGADPLELRLASDSANEPVKGLPWSSRSLVECLRRGAEIFRWSERPKQVGSLTRGDWQIGYGMASAMYPCYTSPATADIKLGSDLSVRVAGGAHDLGTGTYTIAQQICARELGIDPKNVRVELGDSDLAPNVVAGGSRQTGSFGSAIVDGCRQLRSRLIDIATTPEGKLAGVDPASIVFAEGRLRSGNQTVALKEIIGAVSFGVIEARGTWTPDPVKPKSVRELYRTGAAGTAGMVTDRFARAAFGAQFVEVAVDRLSGEIRVPRMVGVFAAGRIINERTARSQLLGGMIWGVGSVLHEATEIDHRHARFVNTDLGEYLMPVNADVPSVQVEFVEELDEHVNPLGAKGIGELGITGVNAAIANAVFHATGKRLRDLPIRMEKLLNV